MKPLSYLILLIISLPTLAGRGIEFGASCQEINLTESLLGSQKNSVEQTSFIGKHREHEAWIIYDCDSERWSQLIIYGSFSKQEALKEIDELAKDTREEYGGPSYGYGQLSLMQRVKVFYESLNSCCEFYTSFRNTYNWTFENYEVSIYPKPSHPSMARVDNSWSISYSLDSPLYMNLCNGENCEKIRFGEIPEKN